MIAPKSFEKVLNHSILVSKKTRQIPCIRAEQEVSVFLHKNVMSAYTLFHILNPTPNSSSTHSQKVLSSLTSPPPTSLHVQCSRRTSICIISCDRSYFRRRKKVQTGQVGQAHLNRTLENGNRIRVNQSKACRGSRANQSARPSDSQLSILY
jgi:hypothetical protein